MNQEDLTHQLSRPRPALSFPKQRSAVGAGRLERRVRFYRGLGYDKDFWI